MSIDRWRLPERRISLISVGVRLLIAIKLGLLLAAGSVRAEYEIACSGVTTCVVSCPR